MIGRHTETLSMDDLMRARELLDRNEIGSAVVVVTGRQARVVLGMPGRLINKARMEVVDWRGTQIKVIGL